MKKWILILILAVLTINCSNDDENNITEQLIGEWEWIESSGGIQGETTNPEITGENRTLEISSDKIKYFTDGILTIEINYHLEKGISILSKENVDLMIFENGSKHSVILFENTLVISGECYDCYQNEYIKK